MAQVQVPPEAAHFSLKNDCLGRVALYCVVLLCEWFEYFMYIHMQVMRPMVQIAREVIAANGYSDTIIVVPKRSTDMTEADMEGGRANILVTEVFDTELIGEGALLTYSHALKHLMQV